MGEPLEVVFVGLGYIELPTAVVMANHGVRVHGVDVNASAVERIQRGEVTIVEPGLEEQLKKAIDSGQPWRVAASNSFSSTSSSWLRL